MTAVLVATYARVVEKATNWRFRALPLLLLVPLVAVAATAVVALSAGGRNAEIPLAPAAMAGGLHPMAGSFVPDGTALEECASADFACLEQALGNVAYARGPRSALALVDARLAEDEGFAANCHRIVHVIGSASLARAHGDVAKAFTQGSPTCASGYYHGILERAFIGVTTRAKLAERARSLCDTAGVRRFGYLDRQCRHGLGHGLMIQTGYDLPTALAICAGLPTRWDHLTCSNGVFMENADTRFGFRSRWLDDEDPLYPCREVTGLDRRHCYARVPTLALRRNGGSYAGAAATCSSLAAPWSRYCFRGLGRDAVDFRFVRARTLERCALAGDGGADCLFGAARYVSDRLGPEGRSGGAGFCRAARADVRDACFAGVGSALGLVEATNPARRRACAAIAPAHVDACTRAAIAEVDPNASPLAWG